MRSSDWSSDVCSSDLVIGLGKAGVEAVLQHFPGAADPLLGGLGDEDDRALPAVLHRGEAAGGSDQPGDMHVVEAGVHHRHLLLLDVDLGDRRGIWKAASLAWQNEVLGKSEQLRVNSGGTTSI